jgi:hypothetical protein
MYAPTSNVGKTNFLYMMTALLFPTQFDVCGCIRVMRPAKDNTLKARWLGMMNNK